MTIERIRQIRPWLGAVLIGSALVLSGCGGNGENSAPPNTAAAIFPANITTTAGFIDFLVSLVSTTDDTSEAVALGDLEAPFDDVSEARLETKLFE